MLDSETSHKFEDGPIGTSFDAAKVFNRRIAMRCEISVYFYFLFFSIVSGFKRSNTLNLSDEMENTNMPKL